MVAIRRHSPLTAEKQASSLLERKERMLAWASTGSNAKFISAAIVLCLHCVYRIGKKRV
jgi:hypothetical protein